MDKICSSCKMPKHSDEYYSNPRTKDGLCCYCKSCTKEGASEWRKRNPEKVQRQRKDFFGKKSRVFLGILSTKSGIRKTSSLRMDEKQQGPKDNEREQEASRQA